MTKTQRELMKLRHHEHRWSYFADSPEDVSADNSVDVTEAYYEAQHPGAHERLAPELQRRNERDHRARASVPR